MSQVASGGKLSRRVQIIGARAASGIEQYREALVAGRLTVCCNCAHFTFAEDPAALGRCATQGEVAPFAPDRCPHFELSANPVAPKCAPTSPFLTGVDHGG